MNVQETHTNKKRLRPTDDENEDTALPKAKKVKADSKVGEAALTTKKRSRTEDEAETATTLPAVKKARTDLNEPPKEVLKVFVCGSDDSGELGFGKQKGYKAIVAKTPRLNQHLSGVVQITLGGMHGIALINDNKILTWGVNDQFALGRDTTATNVVMKDIDDNNNGMDADDDVTLNVLEATPTAIESSAFPPNTKFVQVCAGDSTSFALTSTGLVYGWGIFRVNINYFPPHNKNMLTFLFLG